MVDALKKYAKIDAEKLNDKEVKKLLKKHDIEIQGKYSKGLAISLLFEELCEEKLIQPVHIIDHPVEICPLAKPCRYDNRYAERAESFVNTWEVGNLYTEINDPVLQLKNFQEQAEQMKAGDDEAHPLDMDFVESLEYGLPPNSGNGVGVDRMIMLMTGQESIRDIILFPIMKPLDIPEAVKSKESKIAVAVINKGLKLKLWEEMNTVAHLNAAFAARIGKSLFLQDEITTKDDKNIKLNIQHAIMIKTAKSKEEVFNLIKTAKNKGLQVSEFTREMIETTDDTKVVDWTKSKKQKDIEYLGVLVFGKKSVVDKITEKFELYDSSAKAVSTPKKKISKDLSGLPSRKEAMALLKKHVKDKYQVEHAKTVAYVMEKYAEKLKENKQLWYVTGLLHDLDYQEHPNEHPFKEIEWFKKKKYPDELVHAVEAHCYLETGVKPQTKLAFGLLAVDELTGIMYAYSLMRPDGFKGMKVKSFKKKFKDMKFAAKVSREEINYGIEKFGIEFNEHVEFVIKVLEEMNK